MKLRSKAALFFAGLVLMGQMSLSHSATIVVDNATISRTLIDSNFYGGCMARLQNGFVGTQLNCPGDWVTFNCAGNANFGGTVNLANWKLQLAQVAQQTGKSVRVFVNDAKKINGYCFAERIDLIEE